MMLVKYFVLILFFCAFCSAEKAKNSENTQWNFQQKDYDIKLERANVESFNHSYLRNARGEMVLYNRTHRVYNGSMDLLVDIPSNIKLDVQVYKFMSNEYRFFPITISLDACAEYKLNAFHRKDSLKGVSNIGACPIKKGFYYVRNYLPDFSKFPPYIPRGDYKKTTKWYHRSNLITEVDVYGSVKDKPFKWQK